MITGRVFSIFFFVLTVYLPAAAQLQPVYAFQKDDTILKKSLYQQSIEKKKELIASVDKKLADDYKKIYDEQFKEIAAIWESTRSVTAPEAYHYLQSLVQKIIGANPELKDSDARVIFSRDWWPNAFSMGDGTIVINAGLMVFLDNEAELIFVICHELAHYYLEHTPKMIRKYVETVNSESYQNELKRLSKTAFRANQQLEDLAKSFAFNTHRHRRENEADADRQAFIFMKKTGYDCNAIRTGLALLDKVDDTSVYKPLVLESVLDFPGYPFKKKWIQTESSIFSQLKEDDSPLTKSEKDSLKTHPDCSKRIELLQDSIRSLTSGGQKFLVNETVFHRLKKDFFIEMTEQCYREKNLSRNLYLSLLQLQSDENNSTAIYSVARCLNQVYLYQKDHKLGLLKDVENKTQRKDYNLLLRMLDKLRLEEIASINHAFCQRHSAVMKDHKEFHEEMKQAQKFKN